MANLKDEFLKSIAKKTFGGDDFLSSIIREKMGVKKEKKEKSPSKVGTYDSKKGQDFFESQKEKTSQKGRGSASVLKTIAQFSTVLPGMARDMKTMSQNIQKLVQLKGGKSTSSVTDYFREQQGKKGAPGKTGTKTLTPTPTTSSPDTAKKGGGKLGNIGKIIGDGLVKGFKALFNPKMLLKVLTKLALPLLIITTLFSGIIDGFKKYQETGSLGEAIISGFGGMLSALTFGLFGDEQLRGLLDSLGEILKPVTDSVSKIFDSIKGFFKNIFGDIIKIEDDPKPVETPVNNSSSGYAPTTSAPSTAITSTPSASSTNTIINKDEANKTGAELTSKLSEMGAPTDAIPKEILGDLAGVMNAGGSGEGGFDIGAVIAAGEEFKKKYPVKAPTSPSPVVTPPAVAASPSPIVPPAPASGAPTPSSDDSETKKLAEYFSQPENAADNAQLDILQNRIGTIKRAIRDTKSLIASSTTPEEKERHEKILKEQLEPGLEATKKQKKAILDKARNALQIKTTGESGATSAPAPPSSPTVSPGTSGGMSSGGSVGAGGSGGSVGAGGGGGGASVTPTPSAPSGASLSSDSASVAESQRMESAADQGVTVNAGTTNNSSGSIGKPSKQTASAYDDSFAQRLATT